MITKEILRRRVKQRFDEYKNSNSIYGSKPESMFLDDGKFNINNWNGGDDIIRQYISVIEKSDDWNRVYKEIEYENDEYDLLIHYKYFEDHQFVTFIINSWEKDYPDIAFFRIYKHRGKTELAMYNGNYMNIDQYIFLLNLIEKTGFEFSL